MARYDKYEPKGGGFRAPLAAAHAKNVTALGTAGAPLGVGLDVNGRIVAGAGQSGVVGVLIDTVDKAAGDIIDVMTDGEIVEFGGAAGTEYYVDPADGVISANRDRTAAGTGILIGWTVEAGRLIVRLNRTL